MTSRTHVVLFAALAANAAWAGVMDIGAASVSAFADKVGVQERLHRIVDATPRAAGAGVQGHAFGGSGPSGAVPGRPRGAARVFFDKPASVLVSPARRPS